MQRLKGKSITWEQLLLYKYPRVEKIVLRFDIVLCMLGSLNINSLTVINHASILTVNRLVISLGA